MPTTSITILKSNISKIGGLEKYTLRLAKAFKERGADVHLLTSGIYSSVESLKNISVKSYIPKNKLSLLKVREYENFCHQHLNTSQSSIIFGLDRNRFQTHIRAGNGVHAAYLDRRKSSEGFLNKLSMSVNPLHKLILSIEKESFENKKLKTLFTNSQMVKNEILNYYDVDESKIQVIHNGVEWKEMHSAFVVSSDLKPLLCKELCLDEHVFHFLFIGHNFERKGLKPLMDALSKLSTKEFHLSVLGTDKHLNEFKSYAQRLGLSKQITFFGSRKDIIKFYQVADCLVIPSIYDPFANVTLEALSMGLQVISSRANGASEILQNGCGYLLDHIFEVEAFTHTLAKALMHPKKGPSAQNCRNSVQHLDFPHQLKKMVDATFL
ncbi:MAG: glycosyltransferase family 1 protein [Chlamydiae bacterium]|nr:glycosyltransferase family 1 protein [Chlamydiota bacterium]